MKRTLPFVLLIFGLLSSAGSARAQSFYFEHGELRRLPEVGQPIDSGRLLVLGQSETAMDTIDNPGPCGTCCNDCYTSGCGCGCVGTWHDNTSVFFAGDGWNTIADDDDNNNFGLRIGFNSGFALGDSALRGQFGASYGAYDFHGREGTDVANEEASIEEQVFLTGGVYKRSDVCCGDYLSYGLVYDVMLTDNTGERTDSIGIGQVRGLVGYALNEASEVGVWAAFRAGNDTVAGVPYRAMDQINFFWHYNWIYGADTMAYLGWSDDPGMMVFALNGQAPLSSSTALFGNVVYNLPSTGGGDTRGGVNDAFNQETWNVTFGLVYYFGGKAVSRNVSGNAGLPLLPVADNGTFMLQAPQNL